MLKQSEVHSTAIQISNLPLSPFTNAASRKPVNQRNNSLTSGNELHRKSIQERHSIERTLMANVGYLLAKRKQLHIQR